MGPALFFGFREWERERPLDLMCEDRSLAGALRAIVGDSQLTGAFRK